MRWTGQVTRMTESGSECMILVLVKEGNRQVGKL
jgi:hypothetical protein